MLENATSEKVRSLYQKYPYPPREPGTSGDAYVDYILSLSGKKRDHKLSFLDAGCGTGSSVIGAALFQPDLDIYGCDFCPEALKAIEDDLQDLNLKNVTLKEVDLLNFPKDFGPERGFDVIFCTGVIHHTPDPLGILKNLAKRLAPQGVLRLMVYSEKGRSGLYRFARVVKRLLKDNDGDWESKVLAVEALMIELEKAGRLQGFQPPCLRGPFEDSHLIELEEFADRYIHPHDVPYTLETLKEHVEAAGLNVLRWFEQRDWDLAELLPQLYENGDFPEDPWAQYAIIEELFDRDQYDLYLVGPDFQPNLGPLTFDCPLRVNPQVHFTETSFRGIPMEQKAKLLFYPEEDITYNQARIIKAVSRKTLVFEDLLNEWDEDMTEDWLHSAAYLLYRDYLYRPNF